MVIHIYIYRYYAQCRETDIYVGGKHEYQCQCGTHEEGQQVDEEVLHGRGEAAYTLVNTGLQFARLIVGP